MAEVQDQSELGVHFVPPEQDERHSLVPAVDTHLVMVNVTWAHWGVTPTASEEQRSSSRHESLLTILLGGRTSLSDASESDSPIAQPGASISLEPQTGELKDRTDSLRDRISSDPLLLWPQKWYQEKRKEFEDKNAVTPGRFVDAGDAVEAVRFIVDGLKQCERTANRATLRRLPGLLAAQMNLFACRVYLTPDRAARLINGPLGKDLAAPGHAMIDLRFREHLGDYWLYATFSVWTHQPSISLDSSKSVEDRGDASPLIDRPEALRERYADALRRGFQDHVHAFFPAAQMTILDRKYQPPRFWVARGRDLTTAGSVSENGRTAGHHELLKKLLCVPHPRTTGLGAGDIDGRARVFRRFVSSPRWAHDRPIYLVLPFASSAIDQDDNLRLMIQTLSDLEADAATRLFDIITDIDMYRSQLNLYEKIASDGLALWDQIALFLPVARFPRLGNAHRLIELIHQIVLQSIADLEEEAANAQSAIERVEAVAHDLIDQFDRKFTERPVPGRVAIRDSLVKAGYFDKARHAAQSVNEQSRQVRATYKALLASMTYAFDERRVRETDALQSLAILFAIVLGALSSWNEFLAVYINNWNVGSWVRFGLAVIILAIVAAGVMWSRRSRLTSSQFDKNFKKLRGLLVAFSSDSLDRYRAEDERKALDALAKDEKESESRREIATAAQEQVLEEAAKKRHRIDQILAEETAALLDVLPKQRSREHDWTQGLPKARLGELHERVEAWALRALLVTERPRQFYRSALPLLTFLYRFFPITSGKPSQESDWSAAENQVSDYDFRLTVMNHCGGEPEHVPALMRWGHRQVRDQPNASEFVKHLKESGLSGHMTNERFRKMLGNINESSWKANSNEFEEWSRKARVNLKAAEALSKAAEVEGDTELYQNACMAAEDCAQLGLTGYLRGVGAGVPADYDLVRLSVEARAAKGGPLSAELQNAIWRLSTYQTPRDQLSFHPAGRATLREYGKSDAETALGDAKIVLGYVDRRLEPPKPPPA